MNLWPGRPRPLGLHYDGTGANVAVYAPDADGVELCLFDDDGAEQRLALPSSHGPIWHGYVPLVEPGTRYGFRVHGPWDPRRGLNHNPAKLLLDPYARAIEGAVTSSPSLRLADDDLSPDPLDNAAAVPRSVVVNPYFDWGGDTPPQIPLSETIVYEVHVKGFTKRFPGIDDRWRGTYVGLAHPEVIAYLQRLGVTAVELLPVHQLVHDPWLQDQGRRNYWGYNTIGYFAPHNEYAALGQRGQQVQEFRRMVQALHAADIEVILDVVFNHSAEGGFHGPTLAFRGFTGGYYHADPADLTRYHDFTGCGNSLDMTNPFVLQLVMDSLRYWVTEMHVDGFRFDLAATLARETGSPDKLSSFFDLVQQDPVLQHVKLIAEPWDIGWGGYQVGNFPWLWAEWNGKFRDCVRDAWRSQAGSLPELATRLTGSADLYGDDGRRPFASVNFVTAHDGFTLRDLVSYNDKHNEANGEGNRDGESHNRSWNCGAEGPTDDPGVNALRSRQQRNFLATLLLAQGVPMLLGGDEFGRTQHGNNNAYCQDSELSWFDWDAVDETLVEFTRRLIELRRANPVLHRRRFFTGRPENGSGGPDLQWFRADGQPMDGSDWADPGNRCLAAHLDGDAITERGSHGEEVVSDSFYLCINTFWEPVVFRVPEVGGTWVVAVDTAADSAGDPAGGNRSVGAGTTVELTGRSLVLLQRPARARR